MIPCLSMTQEFSGALPGFSPSLCDEADRRYGGILPFREAPNGLSDPPGAGGHTKWNKPGIRIRASLASNLNIVFVPLFFLSLYSLPAQGMPLDSVVSTLKDQALVLDIVARVVEGGEEDLWNSSNSRVTIPGRPVGFRLTGENVVVVMNFTPYSRQSPEGGRSLILLAQGMIWVNVPGEGAHYRSTMQTIPMEFGEPVYFFPLGRDAPNQESCLEILLELRPYEETSPVQGEAEAVPPENKE
jgi:hypothetical protein